jgi:hypothetical protein
MDNIATDFKNISREGVYWIHLAQDRDMRPCEEPVNMEMNLRDP